MAKFMFPAGLVGVHEEYRHVSGGTEAPIGTVAFLINGAIVCIARTLLTEVLDEPPARSVVLDRNGDAWQSSAERDLEEGLDWYCTHGAQSCSWESLNETLGPLTVVSAEKCMEEVGATKQRYELVEAERDAMRLIIERAGFHDHRLIH